MNKNLSLAIEKAVEKISPKDNFFIDNNKTDKKPDLFSLTSQKIDLVNARNIIPGHSVQIAHAQKNPYSIRYIFPDPINEAGWQIYALQMIIDEGFGGSEGIYHILSLKEQARVACQTFIEGKYYTGKIN